MASPWHFYSAIFQHPHVFISAHIWLCCDPRSSVLWLKCTLVVLSQHVSCPSLLSFCLLPLLLLVYFICHLRLASPSSFSVTHPSSSVSSCLFHSACLVIYPLFPPPVSVRTQVGNPCNDLLSFLQSFFSIITSVSPPSSCFILVSSLLSIPFPFLLVLASYSLLIPHFLSHIATCSPRLTLLPPLIFSSLLRSPRTSFCMFPPLRRISHTSHLVSSFVSTYSFPSNFLNTLLTGHKHSLQFNQPALG